MSRVRDALKRANEMQTPPAVTEQEAQPAYRFGAQSNPPRFNPPHSMSPQAAAETEIESDRSRRPKYYRLLRNRWVRKLLRLAGVQTSIPIRRCEGVTRMGQPCRGPAMANGYCRLHGGSRQGTVAAKARGLMERVMPAR